MQSPCLWLAALCYLLAILGCRAAAETPAAECYSPGWQAVDNITMTRYITRNASNLMEGERVFRFISFNIPNLLYIEDYLRKDYPIQFVGRFTTE